LVALARLGVSIGKFGDIAIDRLNLMFIGLARLGVPISEFGVIAFMILSIVFILTYLTGIYSSYNN